MRRYVPLLIAGGALIAAACSDVSAPTRTEATPTLAHFMGGPNSWAASVGPDEDANASSYQFTIPAAGGTVKVGEFTLTFGSRAVCDPATSGYGPIYWKLPCTSLTDDFTITASTFKVDGNSFVGFSPDIRFNPESNVEISTTRKDLVGAQLSLSLVLKYAIWYSVRVGDTRFYIDEAFYDPTLLTHFDTRTGKVTRKLRHFSQVVIRTGYCEENPDAPECQDPPPE